MLKQLHRFARGPQALRRPARRRSATQAQASELRSKAMIVLQPAHDRVAGRLNNSDRRRAEGPVFEPTPYE